jgi:hypothetical protein
MHNPRKRKMAESGPALINLEDILEEEGDVSITPCTTTPVIGLSSLIDGEKK